MFGAVELPIEAEQIAREVAQTFSAAVEESGVAPRRYGELINLHARQFAWFSQCFLGIGVGTESAQLLAEKAIELVEIVKGQETLRIAAEESRKIPKARMH
jgi:hypothetical protein